MRHGSPLVLVFGNETIEFHQSGTLLHLKNINRKRLATS
jgi:hypothetical protein